MAKGGQNWLPSRMSGRKPPKVVIVVDTICRLESITTRSTLSPSPRCAPLSCCKAVRMMIAALIDTPMEPMTPIRACTPKG